MLISGENFKKCKEVWLNFENRCNYINTRKKQRREKYLGCCMREEIKGMAW
jgi:hypothetical protein